MVWRLHGLQNITLVIQKGNKNMKFTHVLFALLALTLVGCTNGKVDLLKGAETAVHLKLLDAEFDRAVEVVNAQPFNGIERSLVNQAIAEVQMQREFIRTLHGQNAGRILVAGTRAQSYLDDVTDSVQAGRSAYLSHLERTGQGVDPLLQSYYDSAVIARANLQAAINSGAGISGVDLAQYLTLGLRVIAAVNGVPIVDSAGQPDMVLS